MPLSIQYFHSFSVYPNIIINLSLLGKAHHQCIRGRGHQHPRIRRTAPVHAASSEQTPLKIKINEILLNVNIHINGICGLPLIEIFIMVQFPTNTLTQPLQECAFMCQVHKLQLWTLKSTKINV